jgi:hypothetical protein
MLSSWTNSTTSGWLQNKSTEEDSILGQHSPEIDFLPGHRLAEVVSLKKYTTLGQKILQLILGLHPFHYHLFLEPPR